MINNNTCEAFEMLKKYIMDHHNGKTTSGGKEVTKRCHICGDSRDSRDRHMYIGMKDGLIVYNCFKCGGGLVTPKFLNDIGCYDTTLIKAVNDQNKLSSKINNLDNRYRRNKQYYIPTFYGSYGEEKINYINQRLGTAYTLEEIALKFNIVINLKDFLPTNNINISTRHESVMMDLNRYFVGFLTVDKEYIIMRRIVDEGIVNPACDSRYVNYNINNIKNGNRFYIIPGFISPTMGNIEIHIAEGPFDILGIYSHLDHKMKPNNVFGCCCGMGYDRIVQYFIKNIGLIKFTLHVYPDANVNDSLLKWKLSFLKIFNIPAIIHRNRLSKDFGVPKNLIDEQIYQLII